MEEAEKKERCIKLKNFYNESENRVKTDAMICLAYTDKISTESINDKVNAQMNAIKIGIKEINPKFKEGSKNYDTTKELVTETLAKYEEALTELSEFYDGKIEQLVLRKVELESGLLGSILNEEYLRQTHELKTKQKESDKVRKSVRENIKSVFEKLKNRKKENHFDPRLMEQLMDEREVEIEIDDQINKGLEKSVEDQKVNKDFIEKAEKEIALIKAEIERINERKRKSIFDAMEVGDKAMVTSIKKPKVFKKITRFFVARFNTAKVVQSTIIDPLNLRIEAFRINELANMKG